MKKVLTYFCFVSMTALFSSCFGASADITINTNGSGTIALEYRVSQMLEEIGRLDGNESFPVIPVGKKDFQRTVARIPGLTLSSYSAKEVGRPRTFGANGGKDLVTKVVLKFKNTDALLAFLDGVAAGTGAASSGSHATLIQKDGKNVLRLVLLDPSDGIDADLCSLMKEISSGYEMRFNFTLPKPATLSVVTLPSQAEEVFSQGKKVSFSISMGDFLTFEDGCAFEVVW